MEDIVKKYWELVLKDKKYLEEYFSDKIAENNIREVIEKNEEYFSNRNTINEMYDVMHSKVKESFLNNYTEDEMYDNVKKEISSWFANKIFKDIPYTTMKIFLKDCFIWRKINSYEELEDIVHSEDANELLKINDYYTDEMFELLEEQLNVNFKKLADEGVKNIVSDCNLRRILEDSKTPKQLKDCINLKIESETICDELYEHIKQNK